MSIENFREWLQKELDKRDWSPSDLARAAQMSPGTLSNILAGKRGIGNDTATSISKGLKLPPDEVFRAAGILPPKSERDELIEKIHYIFDDLPPEEQDNVIEYARMRHRLAEEKARQKSKGKNTKPRPATAEK